MNISQILSKQNKEMYIVRKIKDDGDTKVFELRAYYFYLALILFFIGVRSIIFIQENFYPGEGIPTFISLPIFFFLLSIFAYCFWEFRQLLALWPSLISGNYEIEHYWKVPLLVDVIKVVPKKSSSEEK